MITLAALTTDEWNLVVAVISLAATLITAVVAIVISFIAYRLSHRAAKNDLLFEVRSWGDEVVDLLSDATGLCELDPSKDYVAYFLRRHELIQTSSSLWDRGRFFFPNHYRKDFSLDKPEAFQGIRPKILDLMKLIYQQIRAVNYRATGTATNSNRRQDIVEVRRYFVSVIQEAVDFRSATDTARDYEKRLSELDVPPLPSWVKDELSSNIDFGGLKWKITPRPPTPPRP